MGPELTAFESAMAGLVGARHAIGVSSGTTGLHLCVLAANVCDGDLVVTSPFSFVASTNVLLYERAIPVFVDVDPKTGNIDPLRLADAVSDLQYGGRRARRWLPRNYRPRRTTLKAILPVDVFGQPADFDPISDTAKQHGLSLIEDSCEALGSEYKGRPAGMLGDVGVFAFYPNKQITTGEGGVVVTSRDDWAERMRALRNQGRAPGDAWLDHTYLGYNYRLDEMSAALGRQQLARLEILLAKRQRVAGWYNNRLLGIDSIQVPTPSPGTSRIGWFVYVIRLERGVDRNAVAGRLEKEGVPSRPYFPSIHLQPYMRERFGYMSGDYPISEDLSARSLALPFSTIMTERQVESVCQKVTKALR
jgi:dTDP-4-amino-4,6-dideoxygalactose transaminase